MGTNRSFDAHKAVILERILRAWEKCPRLTFGELLDATCTFGGKDLNALKDVELCEEIERFALLGTETLNALVPEPITATRYVSEQIREMCYHRILRVDCAVCKPR
jgi:hypothetical protein